MTTEAQAGSRTPDPLRHRLRLGLILLALAFVNIVVWFPGAMTNDSFTQYDQIISGDYSDWHPPVMARLWSLLLPLASAGAGLLVLHVALYWAALFLIGDALALAGSHRASWLVVLIGLWPPFFVVNAFIWKDVGMAVALLAAFAVVFHRRAAGARIGWGGGGEAWLFR